MKPSLLKKVPQEIQNHWFSAGFTEQLNALKTPLINFTEAPAKARKLDKSSKIQLLILLAFNLSDFSYSALLQWINDVDLELVDCVELIPYLKNANLLYHLRITQPQLMSRIRSLLEERADEFMNYFLKYEKNDVMHFLNDCKMSFLKTWAQDNHATVLDFCLTTTDAAWYIELLPLLDEEALRKHVGANESLIYDQMNSPLLSVLILKLKDYFPNFIRELLYAKRFEFFNALIQNGHFSLFKKLFDFLEENFSERHSRVNLVKLYIYSQDLRPFYLAVKYKNFDFIRWVADRIPGELATILKSTSFLAQKIALAYRHDDIFNFLGEQSGDHQMLHHCVQFGSFENEDFDGDFLNIALQFDLVEKRDEFFQKICENYSPEDLIFNNKFNLLTSAASSGNLSNLEWVLHQAQIISPDTDNLDQLLINAKFEPFIFAALQGHVHVLEWLIVGMSPDLRDELFIAFQKFFQASYQKELKYRLPFLQWLSELFEDRISELLIDKHFSSFKHVLSLGDAEVLDWIFRTTGRSIINLPEIVQVHMFEIALNLGRIEFLNRMICSLSSKKFNQITQQLDFQHLSLPLSPETMTWVNTYTRIELPTEEESSAVDDIDLSMPSLTELESLDIKTLTKTAKSQGYLIFESCVKHGLLDCLDYLSKNLPKVFLKILIRNDYRLIKQSLDFQQFAVFEFLVMQLSLLDDVVVLPILNWLELFFAHENISAIIWIFEADLLNIQTLTSEGFVKIFDSLIQSDSNMVMDFVFPSIKPQIAELVASRLDYISILINHEFFLTVEELLKDVALFENYESLIYQAEHRDELFISFMAELTEKYFTEIFEKQQFAENIDFLYHLVRYSIQHSRHEEWVKKAISLAEFRPMAVQFDNQLIRLCIRIQDQEITNLLLAIPEVRALAQEHQFYAAEQRLDTSEESAMRALSCFDQENLRLAIDHYTPRLETLTVSLVINRLKLRLIKEYAKNPAEIQIKSERVALPVSWDKFEKLSLGRYQNRALKAYYQHEVHTALRFLSMPNCWIDPDMNPEWIEVNEQGQKGAAIKPFISLLAILYLAVNDKDMQPNEDFTMQSRWHHFYLQLALAGRAHNIEKKVVVLDADGNETEREVDDMKADKPTCGRGIMRNLHQCVLGHPLFTYLNLDTLKQEVNSFVYRYYRDGLDVESAKRLQDAFDLYIIDGDMNAFQVLKSFDIPEDRQALCIEEFKTQYKSKWTSHFEQFVRDKFRAGETDAHVINFHQSSVQQVLDALMRKRKGEDNSAGPKRHCA